MPNQPIERKAIGGRLRELRLAKGLTQVEVAEQLSTDQTVISRAELGVQVSLATLAQLADAYEATLDYIVRGRGKAA